MGRQLSGKGDAPATSYPYAGYNKTSQNGVDRTIYDGHGHAIMRFDHSHFHNGMNPHVHVFKWWIHDGKWRWNGKTGDVYLLEKY